MIAQVRRITDPIHASLRSKSMRNSAWIIGERVVSVGIATLITLFSARYLGVEKYGVLTYGLAWVTLFTGVMKLGIDSIMVNELINNKDKQGSFLGTSIVLRLFSSLLSIASLFVLLNIINTDNRLIITVTIIQATILLFQSFNILDFWFQSELKAKYVSIAKISASIIMASYSVYILVAGKGVVWFAASTTLSGLVLGAVLLMLYMRQSKSSLNFSAEDGKYLLSKSHHFIVASIISMVYLQIDRIMIGNLLDQSQIGLYSAGLMLCTAWLFFPEALITSLRPGIIQAKAIDNELYLYKLKRLYFMIFWLSMGMAALIALSAPIIIPLLFGQAFVDAVVVAQIAVWYVPFSLLGMARTIWIVAENKHKYPKYYLSHGLVLNVLLNIVLIPMWGIVGAAVATVATELLTCFISPLFYRNTRMHTKIVSRAIMHQLSNKQEN